MKKGLMMIAFAVLLMGFAFADVQGAAVTPGPQGKITATTAGSLVTEGGNVTEMNLTSNQSTEKWAGLYGNATGNLLLHKGTGNALYVWSWNPASGGEVCVNVGGTFAWALSAATTATEIDTAWDFAAGDLDSAASTFITTAAYNLAGIGSGTTVGAYTRNYAGANTWETFALEDTGTPAKTDLAFCVNVSSTATTALNTTGGYQLMAATNQTVATFETYYFYIEMN